MKRLLSLLLCSLLIMSSIATVAFADAPEAITFGNYLAQIPAGSKIIVNTGDVAEGNTVVADINGVASTLVKADGYYAVTVPAGENYITVSVKNGDEIVAETETIHVFGLSYLSAGEVRQNATFEIDSTNLIGNKKGFYDVGMNGNWYDNITNHLAVSKTDEADAYVQGYIWGTAASDPNNAEGYTKRANGGNTAFASGVRGLTTVSKFSVDYRFDKIEEINPEDGTVVRSLPMRNPEEIKVAGFADSDHSNDSPSIAEASMLTVQYFYPDTYDYDNDDNSEEDIRSGFSYWTLDRAIGKPVFKAYDDNGEIVKFPVDNFNEGWNTYSVIVDMPNDTVYGYINDIYVGSGHLGSVTLTRPEGHEDAGKKKLIVPKETLWATVGGIRVYNSADAVSYYSIDNYDVTSYTGFASTEPQIEVTNKTLDVAQPAGAKTDISVVAANIPVNGGMVAFVNGAKVPLTMANGAYAYNGALEAGYTSISIAMVDAKGDIVTNSDGDEIKSEEWTYYAFGGIDAKDTQAIYPELNFPTWAEVSAMSSAEQSEITNAFYAAGYNGYNEYYDLTDYAARKGKTAGTNKLVVNGTDDKYFSATSWGSYYADPIYTTNPDAARKDASGTIFTSSKRSGDTGSAVVDRYWDISVDYKVDSVDITEVGTGELVRTVNIDSADALKGVWHWAEWNILDNQYVWDSNYNGLRAAKTLFGLDKTTGKPFARTYDETGAAVNTIVDVNPGEWHNYRAIVDIEEDCVYLLVDNVLVAQGSLGTYNTSTTDITEVLWPHVFIARQYAADTPSTSGNWTYGERMHASFDDWTVVTYNAMDDATEAIVNATITDNGASLGIIPANLGLEDGVEIDIAVIARAASGAIDMIKYEDVTNESAYKAFGFDMAGIDKVFVWNWSDLSNIELITK